MDTVVIQMELPKDILIAANIPESNPQRELKRFLALFLFKERKLSFGKACELSQLSKADFMDFIGREKVSLNYDLDDYEEDLNTIRGLTL